MNLELSWLHHWLIFKLGRNAWIICSHILDIPITSRCTAQLQPRSALCFISLNNSLNLARLLEYFAFISLRFQSLLIVEVPITICTAQLHRRPALCIISLIKSLNLAGSFNIWLSLPQYSNYCSSSTPHLEAQVLQTPIRHAQCIVDWGWGCWWAGHWSSSRQLDNGESCKADPPQLLPPASQRKRPVVKSCTGRHWQGCCQAAVNIPYVVCFGSMHAPVHEGRPAK